MVAWADRIAYCCHDFEDAGDAGIVTPATCRLRSPSSSGATGEPNSTGWFTALIETVADTGTVALRQPEADALAGFRESNFERIYLRPESIEQTRRVRAVIVTVTDWHIEQGLSVDEAVRYVSGMTDRFLLRVAVVWVGTRPRCHEARDLRRLNWRQSRSPRDRYCLGFGVRF
ncbi:MAG: hypothetical protein ACRD0U_20705 [Acidimicrobiales bacterium]